MLHLLPPLTFALMPHALVACYRKEDETHMKKKMLSLILACAMMLPGAAFAASGVITGDMVNLRTGPGLGYSRIQYLYKGNAVTVNGETNGWVSVSYGGKDGYVYSDYVTVTASSGNLKWGSRGSEVKTLQQNLILLGYISGSADGIFGAKTHAAVVSYQSKNGLAADGIAGKLTQSAISKEVNKINTVISTAKKYLGLAYVTGGTSPSTGFDCSGLTQYSHAQAGISIPRVSYQQAAGGVSISKSKMRPGDIVCFNSPVSHVGIYLGDNKFIHSSKPGDVVKITDLKYMDLTKIVRYTGK